MDSAGHCSGRETCTLATELSRRRHSGGTNPGHGKCVYRRESSEMARGSGSAGGRLRVSCGQSKLRSPAKVVQPERSANVQDRVRGEVAELDIFVHHSPRLSTH